MQRALSGIKGDDPRTMAELDARGTVNDRGAAYITGPSAKIIPKFGYDDSLWSASFLFSAPLSSRSPLFTRVISYDGSPRHPTPPFPHPVSQGVVDTNLLRGLIFPPAQFSVPFRSWLTGHLSGPYRTPGTPRIPSASWLVLHVGCVSKCLSFQAPAFRSVKKERSVSMTILSRFWRVVKSFY